MPTLSIICSSYQTEKNIDRTILSVINQDYSDFEFIIVDNGATDKSPQICDNYAQKDPRIKVFHLPQNIGIAEGKNYGLKKATADYVIIIDADDFLDSGMLASMMSFIFNNHLDICICSFSECDENNIVRNVSKLNFTYERGSFSSANEKFLLVSTYDHYVVWNKIFKRDILKNILFDSKCGYGDGGGGFLSEAFIIAQKIGYIDVPFYHWINYKKSVSKTTFIPVEFMKNSFLKYHKLLRSLPKNKTQKFLGYYIVLWNEILMYMKNPDFNLAYTNSLLLIPLLNGPIQLNFGLCKKEIFLKLLLLVPVFGRPYFFVLRKLLLLFK